MHAHFWPLFFKLFLLKLLVSVPASPVLVADHPSVWEKRVNTEVCAKIYVHLIYKVETKELLSHIIFGPFLFCLFLLESVPQF